MTMEQWIVLVMLLDVAVLWSYPFWRRRWHQHQEVKRSAEMIRNVQQGRVRL